MPSASIIIPTHNRRELLMQTVGSVRAQTVVDFEAIVVDDHSTDDTVERMKSILAQDSRFRMISVPDGRSGAQAARNIGIEASAGRYLILLDSDDLIAPHCLKQRFEVMQQYPELDFAVFPCECFRTSAGDVGVFWNVPTDKPDLDRFLEGDVPWQTTSPMWKREAIASLLPWPENVPVGQDWEFHIRAIVSGLKYGYFGTVDHSWRMAESERDSIGKRTMKPELLKSRVATNEMVLNFVRNAGLLNDLHRAMFAGLFFQSAERIGTRVGWRDGLAVWERARGLDLITDRQLAQGRRYFWMYRFKSLRSWLRGRLQRAWPKGYFVPKSETYLKAPIVGATHASPDLRATAPAAGDACVAPTGSRHV